MARRCPAKAGRRVRLLLGGVLAFPAFAIVIALLIAGARASTAARHVG
jgi:hypothetical protein